MRIALTLCILINILAAKNVLQKHKTSPLKINKQKVDIKEYCPPQDESGESSEEEHEEAGAIKVTKLPPGTTEEAITLFFENHKKSGGGEVEKVEFDEIDQSAVIWFKEAESKDCVILRYFVAKNCI